MNKKLTILIFQGLFIVTAISQSVPIPDLAKVVRPSPAASQFEKYGDYPIDYTTGVPQISIPLYTIQSSRLTLPISLSYHASGFKPRDASGPIAYGWMLNAGGRISRTVQGKSDELTASPWPLKNSSQLDVTNSTDRDYLTQLVNPNETTGKDNEYDIFSYGVNGLSGKFLLKNIGSLQRVPVTLPFKPIKITSNSNLAYNSPIDYFQIVGEDGNIYRFGKSLDDGGLNIESTTPNTQNPSNTYRSSWMLTEIISPDKSDTIIFKYTGWTEYRKTRADHYTAIDGGLQMNTTCNAVACGSAPSGGSGYTTITGSSSELFVSEIRFKCGKLAFDYSSGQLTGIRVLDLDNSLRRTITINRSYFGPNPATLNIYTKLDSVCFKDATSTMVNRYAFNYSNSTANIEQNVFLNLGLDYWNFYNGITTNTGLLPNWTISTQNGTYTVGSANRQSFETPMMTFTLNKITYPTGGTTDFVFEANKITGGGLVGGLRIKQIINTPMTGQVQYKTYSYGDVTGSEDGFGNLMIVPNSAYFYQDCYGLATCTGCPSVPAAWNILKTLNSDFVDGSGIFENYHIFYSSVSEYLGDLTTNSGKTTYDFIPPANTYSNVLFHHLQCADNWHGGEMSSKKIYKNVAGSYSLVDQETYSYFQRPTDTLPGLKAIANFSTNDSWGNPFTYAFPFFTSYANIVKYYDYSITTGINYLQQKTHAVYTTNGNLVNTENYSYCNYHNSPISVTSTNSKNQTIETDTKYPTDLTLYGVAEDARVKLVNNNMLSSPLQSKSIVNGVQQSLVNNKYKDFGTGIPFRDTIEIQILSNPMEARVVFSNYDTKGNLLTQNKANDVTSRYIWDYKSSQPIAEIVNAGSADIAYTSFEADGLGGWTTNAGSYTISTNSVTGKKSFGGVIYKNGVASGTYIVTLWGYAPGTQTVNGVTGTALLTINNWTLRKWEITNPGNVSVSCDNCDEVRLYPKGAQMKTFTYDPLVGITTTCDANNRINYFEYDRFDRLMLVRDQDKNALKKISYNYAGQSTTENIYYNVGQSQYYTRNNCSAGYFGSQVTYTVPANRYSSNISQADADSRAQADISANGQTYANIVGTCTAGVNVQGYNAKSSNYNVSFTNNSTGVVFTFPLNANTFSPSLLGVVASGTYTVRFYPSGSPVTATYDINGFTTTGTGATFNNISITSLSTARMY